MPSYKLRNFHYVKSVNGRNPDDSGNVTIPVSTGGGGSSYVFKEEAFVAPALKEFNLTNFPILEVPLTITINGLVITQGDYNLAGSVITFPEGGVETNDIVRIFYAHGG